MPSSLLPGIFAAASWKPARGTRAQRGAQTVPRRWDVAKNYYAILGVLPSATLDEIRSAYRSRAKKYHPDHFGKDTAPFIDVQEAYDVLSNPVHRTSYDTSRGQADIGDVTLSRVEPEIIRPRRVRAEPLKSTPREMDLGTISPLHSFRTFRPSFDEIYDNLCNPFERYRQRKGEKFQILTMEVVLTPDQAALGGRARVVLPFEALCPTCDGSGASGFWECRQCVGSGVCQVEFPLEVQYPPGIRDYYQIAVPLDYLGIDDVCAVLLFRISREGEPHYFCT